jgi:hypothetical protein
MMKFKSIVMIVIVFAMISFTIIVNAETNHNPINSETTSSSEDFGIYSGSDDPGVIHSETVEFAFASTGVELAKYCIGKGRPGWVDITADSRFQSVFMKNCEKISNVAIKLRKQGVPFSKLEDNDEYLKAHYNLGLETGKVFLSIWDQREKRGWRIY